MTAFARKVLSGAAGPDERRHGEQLRHPPGVHQRHRQGRRQGRLSAVSPGCRCSAATAGATSAPPISPPCRCPSGGDGNGTIYARNKQLALGATWAPTAPSLLEVRFGWSTTEGRQEPAGARHRRARFEAYGITGLPTDPRIAGGLPTQIDHRLHDARPPGDESAVAVPDASAIPKVNYTWLTRRALGEGRLRVPAHPHRGAGRESAVRPRHVHQPVQPSGRRALRTTSTTSPTSCLACARQYALSNVLVANLRQNMHFVYVQDDLRAERPADAERRPALRVRHAAVGERQHPVELRPGDADDGDRPTDGSMEDRSTDQSRPQQLRPAPRLRLDADAAHGRARRLGHQLRPLQPRRRRQPAADQRPAGHQRGRQSRPTRRRRRSGRPQQGYPAGLTDPSKFNPLTANITYMPSDYRSSPVQSWYVSVQREFGDDMLLDVAYVGNRADDLLLFANYNQAAPNNAAGSLSLQSRRPIPKFADITYAFNGGKSRYNALQVKFDWRMRRTLTVLSSLTLSKAKDNGAGSLENPNGNSPAPQDFYNMDADYGTVGLPPAATTAPPASCGDLPFGREGGGWRRARRRSTRCSAAGSWRASTRVYVRASRSRSPTRRRPRSRSRASSRTSAAPTTTGPTSSATLYGGERLDQQLVQPRLRVDADRSKPAVRQRATQQRPRTVVLAGRLGGDARRVRCRSARVRLEFRRRGVQSAQPDQLPRAERQPQRGRLSARSPAPTTRASCSWVRS